MHTPDKALAICLFCRSGSKLTELHQTLKKSSRSQKMEHPSATDPSLSSPVFPSFLAQPSKLPSIFPSALFLLSAQQNAIGPKHCWLPLMLAALLVIGKSFMSSMSLNALNRGQSLATGPSTGRAKQKRRSLALTLTSCFSASSHQWSPRRLSDVQMGSEGRRQSQVCATASSAVSSQQPRAGNGKDEADLRGKQNLSPLCLSGLRGKK